MAEYYFVVWRFRKITKVKKGFIFKKTITKYGDWQYGEEVVERHPTLILQESRKKIKKYEWDFPFGLTREMHIDFMCEIREDTYNSLKKDHEGKVEF